MIEACVPMAGSRTVSNLPVVCETVFANGYPHPQVPKINRLGKVKQLPETAEPGSRDVEVHALTSAVVK